MTAFAHLEDEQPDKDIQAPDEQAAKDGDDAQQPSDMQSADPIESDVLLQVQELTLRFGGLQALDGVSFDLHKGEVFGLIGPNGAGKTACFNVISGVCLPTSGKVIFGGKPVHKLSPHQITRRGMARTFQDIRLFGELTALENVAVGIDARHRTSVCGAVLRSPRHRREERYAVDVGMGLLDFVGLSDAAEVKARELPHESQRRLEIARALATEPKLICLDEPAAGFGPRERESLLGLIESIRDYGYTILLTDHDMRLIFEVTDRIAVLESGRKIAEGGPRDIRNDPAVLEAYLGVPDDELQ